MDNKYGFIGLPQGHRGRDRKNASKRKNHRVTEGTESAKEEEKKEPQRPPRHGENAGVGEGVTGLDEFNAKKFVKWRFG